MSRTTQGLITPISPDSITQQINDAVANLPPDQVRTDAEIIALITTELANQDAENTQTDAEITAEIQAAIAALPADQVRTDAEINNLIAIAIAALPPDQVRTNAEIQALIDATVNLITTPELTQTDAEITAEIAAAVAAVPPPRTDAEINTLINAALAALPPDQVRTDAEINALINAIVNPLHTPELTQTDAEITAEIANAIAAAVFNKYWLSATDSESASNNTTWKESCSITVGGDNPAGTYEVLVTGLWSLDTTGNDMQMRLQQDGVNLGRQVNQEPQDSGGTGENVDGINTGTNQRHPFSIRRIVTLPANDASVFDFDFRSNINEQSAVYDVVMTLERKL